MTKHAKAFTSFFLSLFFCIQTNILLGQNNTTYSKEAQAKIKQFEKNLGVWVQIGNQPFTLADRMKSNHVNGVSIALIKNYKIEWAKGYGWADSAEQRPVTTNTLFQAGSTFNTRAKEVTLKIVGVEMGDNISTREYFVGLLFVYKDENERKEFESLKLPEQIIEIMEI